MTVREEIMRKRMTSVLAVVLLGVLMLWGTNTPFSLAQHATPEAAAPVAITAEILGRATPVTVENPELTIARVTVMPGAVLPVHYHPGSQIGIVVQGELTYTVFTGEIEWYGANDRARERQLIGAGETVVVRPGDALVESPESIHQGRNDGAVPLVIDLSTLFPMDAPRAIVVEATPAP